MVQYKCFVLCSLCLILQLLFWKEVSSRVILPIEREDPVSPMLLGVNNDNEIAVASRGLIDILENFRLWSIERKKLEPTSSTRKPTPEPMGIEAFIPKIEIPKIDGNTLGNVIDGIRNSAQDIIKSFVGPPPTEPEEIINYNGTNISTTIPPNEFFCFLC